ncbi:MAG: cytochrome d ubiquinol oxidase subunit II, partial [Muribaculaceae bacterium]|nr:cytochrome d ubiquinol oxidase subunit II [Muribaculaceae bacterium]
EFTVARGNILDAGNPVISRWAPTHGLEAIASWKNLLLGVAVFFLARTQGALYFVNNISGDASFTARMRRVAGANGLVFALLFVAFVVVLMLSPGMRMQPDGTFASEPNAYLHSLLHMWWGAVILLAGVVMVLYGIFRTALDSRWRAGIWFCGIGTVLVVVILFLLAGYDSMAYYPSLLDAGSSLSISNSSSALCTLKVMSRVSVLIPFVIAYIAYVWRKMNKQPLTPAELNREHHQY